MLSFALVDLQLKEKETNRDHTGGFGSFMHAPGLMGQLISNFKKKLINLPLLHFGYVKAQLRKANYKVTQYNTDTRGEDFIIIASSMHSYKDEIEFAIKQKKKHPHSKIGFFGPFVMSKPDFFKEAADFLIFGEIEAAIEAFLNGKHNFQGILNYGVVKDLSSLPLPDWKDEDLSKYSYFPLLYKRPFMSVQSSRGCSFDCDFCPYMVEQTKMYRRRNPQLVVDEIEFLVKKKGVRSILFRDICFTLNKKHVEDICNEILKRHLVLDWACETRVDCMSIELIDLMHKAGFRGVNFGIETSNNDLLKESGKKAIEIEFQEKIINYLHSKSIRVNAFYMIGLIGDTPETMNQTIKFSKKLNTIGAQFCTMTPFPGTPLYEKVHDQLLTSDFSDFDEYRP
ncbi:MAG: radical SAM protein, partial [Planctomycetes bacterium]|nr:radical SAM protein [Planctomycetota bacterium]